MPSFYTSKVTIEVEVTHQFSPKDGVNIITNRLTGCTIPAVKSIKVLGVESNYKLHGEPLPELVPVVVDYPKLEWCEKENYHIPSNT